jgi:hypothetical protein
VQQAAERVAVQAPFADDPLIQRMTFSPNWCGKMLRLFLSLGMPDTAATCPSVPVIHSVSEEHIRNSKREISGNLQPLFVHIDFISSGHQGVNS